METAQKIETMINFQRNFFHSGMTKELEFRLDMLDRLKKAIISNEEKITEALQKDLGKSQFESYVTEVGFVIIKHFIHDEAFEGVDGAGTSKDARSSATCKKFYHSGAIWFCPDHWTIQLSISADHGSVSRCNCCR